MREYLRNLSRTVAIGTPTSWVRSAVVARNYAGRIGPWIFLQYLC
jgi:hypothetical protein